MIQYVTLSSKLHLLRFSEVLCPVLSHLLFAENAKFRLDDVDYVLMGLYLLLAFGLPLLGYVFMALDFRRYLRSLRRAMVLIVSTVPTTPYWALRSRPVCLKALGLKLPCTEAEVLTAYRERAKALHPDRGGELDEFLQLQRYFEQALKLVRHESLADNSTQVVRPS